MSFEERITLPHTDLRVSRIGLGSSFGVEPADIETAFDGGINYFYWGSIRRNGFGRGVRTLARRARDEMVIALQSYARWPRSMMRKRFESGLLRLDIDCADILILGWHNWRPPQPIIDEALELRERGLVRYLMMSGHNRPFFSEIAKESLLDLFMVRYNAVHRGAERDVFPLLPGGDERPGTCAYTATNRALLLNPRKTPPGERTPGASDCYRFCLSHPEVNMVLSGPANTEQVREALAALEAGPLDESELAWMRRVGDHIRGRPGESAERSAAA